MITEFIFHELKYSITFQLTPAGLGVVEVWIIGEPSENEVINPDILLTEKETKSLLQDSEFIQCVRNSLEGK